METERERTVWEKMASLSLDMLCTFDNEGNFVHVSETCQNILGYTSEELKGRNFTEFIYPDDFTKTQDVTNDILNGFKASNFENRFIHKDGHAVPIQWSGTWSEEDKAVFAVARDITERLSIRKKLEESEQRYKSLFEHNPDIIYLEDKDGLITEVNHSFTEILGLTKEEVENRPATSFLPPELANATETYLHAALQGSVLRFDMELITKTKESRIFDTIKYPILVNGETIGAQTIAKDITPMVRSYETIQKQATKLDTIFESITDAFVMLDKDWNFSYINKEAERLLLLDRKYLIGKNAWVELPTEINGEFYNQFHYSVSSGTPVHFEAYYRGSGIWLEVKAFPSTEGLSIYFSDISERKAEKAELEKLSLVASKTTHGVIITDAEGKMEWANEAFIHFMGYSLSELIGKSANEFLHGEETDNETVEYLGKMLKQAIPFNTKLIKYKKSGEKVWVSLDITPVFNDSGELVRYIAIQKDISERRRIEQELKRLSLVASNTTNSVMIINRDRKIEWVNEGFTRLTGYSFEEAIGNVPIKLLHNEKTNLKSYEEFRKMLSNKEAASFEILHKRKDGQDLWVSSQINPIYNEKGELDGFIGIQTDITERVKSQQELEKLSLVASKTTNSVIITDKEDRIEWVNESFTSLTGYTFSEVEGKNPFKLFPGKETNHTILAQFHERLLHQTMPFRQELLIYNKWEQKKWIEVEVTPIMNEQGEITKRIRIQTDITSRVEAQQELEKFSLVASKANNGIIIADKNWKIEWVNEGFTRLTGYGIEEAIGLELSELLQSNAAGKGAFAAQEKSLMQGDPISFEEMNITKSGEGLWFSVEISAIFDDQGEPMRFIEVHTDITSLKNSELELSRLAKDLYRQNSDLQQFTYIVSHNLRAPVANTIGLTNMLATNRNDSENFDISLNFLRQSVHQLDTVLRDMNTILSIRESKANLTWEQIDTRAVLDQALSSFEEQLQSLGATITVDVAEGLCVRANKAYLHSIFYNLISNALKYRATDRALELRIKCFSKPGTDTTTIYFSDNGSGFDMRKNRRHLFKLYKRFHTQQEGRGMGLYLIKSHLDAMNGRIDVSSKVGAGTKFLIHLPSSNNEALSLS